MKTKLMAVIVVMALWTGWNTARTDSNCFNDCRQHYSYGYCKAMCSY